MNNEYIETNSLNPQDDAFSIENYFLSFVHYLSIYFKINFQPPTHIHTLDEICLLYTSFSIHFSVHLPVIFFLVFFFFIFCCSQLSSKTLLNTCLCGFLTRSTFRTATNTDLKMRSSSCKDKGNDRMELMG